MNEDHIAGIKPPHAIIVSECFISFMPPRVLKIMSIPPMNASVGPTQSVTSTKTIAKVDHEVSNLATFGRNYLII